MVAWVARLTQARRLPQKLLVLHQFRLSMLSNRERLDTGRDEIAVLIQMDGHGPPQTKLRTWQTISASAPPRTWWGWKNFYDEDHPVWTPRQTLGVRPVPWFVSYPVIISGLRHLTW